MLGKMEGRRRGQQRMRGLDSIDSVAMSLSKLGDEGGKPGVLHCVRLQRSQTRLNNTYWSFYVFGKMATQVFSPFVNQVISCFAIKL